MSTTNTLLIVGGGALAYFLFFRAAPATKPGAAGAGSAPIGGGDPWRDLVGNFTQLAGNELYDAWKNRGSSSKPEQGTISASGEINWAGTQG